MSECRRCGLRYIFTPHGKLSPGMLDQQRLAKQVWWRLGVKSLIESASAVVTSSRQESELVRAAGVQAQFYEVPNGYLFAPTESSIAPMEQPYILFLGYLDPRKQPDLLIEAYAASEARHSHKLLLAGPDKYGFKPKLLALAKSLDIESRVHFWGPAYGAAKRQLFEHASCICLPSLAEGLPIVLVEAIGAHTPAIYSRSCNFSELEDAGGGICVDGFSPKDWAGAIDRVALDERRQYAMKEACRLMQPNFTWPKVVARWCDIYDSLRDAKASK